MDERLARYEPVRELGRGGQGTSVLAKDRDTGAEVVIKTLDFQALGAWKDYDLFHKEIAVLNSLDHPGIPKLIDSIPSDDNPVLVYEFLDGHPMSDFEDDPLSEDEVIDLLSAVLEILSYMHGLNPAVIHRDIKPSNIIKRQDGSYALIDFGAAQATTRFTSGSTFIGTNGYMSPEQLMGRAEPRSDLYALGATALHLRTGIHPTMLSGDDGLEIDDEIGEALRTFLRTMCAPLPKRRFPSASVALERLKNPTTALAEVDAANMLVVRQEDAIVYRVPLPKLERNIYLSFIAFAVVVLVLSLFVPPIFPAAAFTLALAVLYLSMVFSQKEELIVFDDGSIAVQKRFLKHIPAGRSKTFRPEDVVRAHQTRMGHRPVIEIQFRDGSQLRFGLGQDIGDIEIFEDKLNAQL